MTALANDKLGREAVAAIMQEHRWRNSGRSDLSGDLYQNDDRTVDIYIDWEGALDQARGMPPPLVERSVFLCLQDSGVPVGARFDITESGLLKAIQEAERYREQRAAARPNRRSAA